MLKSIPPIISPELMFVLMKMGHGDEIVLADGNFPSDSHAQRIVRADGQSVIEVLDAILHFFPLDTFVPEPAFVMEPVGAGAPEPTIWTEFRRIMNERDGREVAIQHVERFAFYEQAKNAYAIVATSESALYANLILKKGVVEQTA